MAESSASDLKVGVSPDEKRELNRSDSDELLKSLSRSANRTIAVDVSRSKGPCMRCSSVRSSVRMPCGHDICPSCLMNYARSEVDGSQRNSITCIECRKEWSMKDLKLCGDASEEELKYLVKRMSENYLLYLWSCPGCGVSGKRQRADVASVHCPNCTSQKKKNAWYCYYCKEHWIGSHTNATCGNKGCLRDEDLVKQLKFSEAEDNEIGRGAYGVVYKGTLDGKPVAVKKVHKLFLKDMVSHSKKGVGYQIQLFKEEGRMLQCLRHPNLVHCYGIADMEGDLTIVMEKMDLSLSKWVDRIKDNSLNPRIPVDISRHITEGINYLHNLKPTGIIHRDLSSNNILIERGNTALVKVADLGVAKYRPPGLEYLNTRSPGTTVYMPPEALIMRPKYTDKIDIFSLGVLMLEIETKIHPNLTVEGIGVTPEVERRKNLLELVKNEALKEIIILCLADNPSMRPSAAELLCRLNTILPPLDSSADTSTQL